jgi:peptidylprolyl isomerase
MQLPQARQGWQDAQMMRTLLLIAAFVVVPALAAPAPPAALLAPTEIVAAAPASEWTAIAPADLLVMDLAPGAAGQARQVVIQLLPPPYSQGWIGNIRKLADAHWWDGTSVNRVQDNYVVQWGDPDGEDKVKAKALLPGLKVVPQGEYTVSDSEFYGERETHKFVSNAVTAQSAAEAAVEAAKLASLEKPDVTPPDFGEPPWMFRDAYSQIVQFHKGWPVASRLMDLPMVGTPKDLVGQRYWPVHCYGTVGVGRDYPPDTGSGAELYAVIGQAPRQLDRNIALVGRVIEGIEHMSSLPRGTGDIGFYRTAAERVPITAIRNGPDVPGLPRYEYLNTESASFARYADARANRRDQFYIRPAGGVDICNVPVPVRRAKSAP